MDYDLILYVKPIETGLSWTELSRMMGKIADTSFLPIAVRDKKRGKIASGLISSKFAKHLDYDFKELKSEIRSLMKSGVVPRMDAFDLFDHKIAISYR